MSQTATTIRIDAELKAEFDKLCDEFGMSANTAFNIYVKTVVATVDRHEGLLMSGPEVVSRGFVYVKESEALLDEVRLYAANTLVELLDRHVKDANQIKNVLRDELSRMLYKKTGRRPMVLPILLDL